MNKLQKIIDMCKAEVSVTVNKYKSNFTTVEEELEALEMTDCADYTEEVRKKIIETGMMIDVTAYQ